MFRLIFKMIVIILFSVFVTVGLAMWKGGEPFRVLGEGTVAVGKSIMEFGDFVDEFIAGGKRLRESYDKLKDVVTTGDDEGASRDK